jgi:hypothetical protein
MEMAQLSEVIWQLLGGGVILEVSAQKQQRKVNFLYVVLQKSNALKDWVRAKKFVGLKHFT